MYMIAYNIYLSAFLDPLRVCLSDDRHVVCQQYTTIPWQQKSLHTSFCQLFYIYPLTLRYISVKRKLLLVLLIMYILHNNEVKVKNVRCKTTYFTVIALTFSTN